MLLEKKNLRSLERWNFKTTDRIGKYFRLDRNERVEKLNDKVFKNLINSIKNEYLAAYPETTEFHSLLAKKNKLNFNQVLVTTGSDTAIRHVFETFVNEKDKILTLDNTYAMYPVYAQMFGAKISYVGYDKNFKINVNQLLKKTKGIKMLILANPNLSGQVISEEDILKIFKYSKNKFLILVDECYYGFYKFTQINKINNFKNLIVTRSFSKTFGIPGVRIGAAFSNSKIINKLNKVRLTHAISAPAALMGTFMIKDKSFMMNNVNEILDGKKFLINFLKENDIKFLNTQTNFIYIKLKSLSLTKKVIMNLAKKKFLVKGPYIKPPFDNMIRITLGSKFLMKRFSQTLLNVLKKS
tara:strand:- start:2957 stop:4021 length:1065 start_codon:yes stop_codon:yes gene_type:complete